MDYSDIQGYLEKETAVKELWQKLLKLLECPVCFEYYDSNATLCVNGHAVCNKCIISSTVSECPICRGNVQLNSKSVVLDDITRECRVFIKTYPDFENRPSDISQLVNIYTETISRLMYENEEMNKTVKKELEECKQNLEMTTNRLCEEISNFETASQLLNNIRKHSNDLEKQLLEQEKKMKDMEETQTVKSGSTILISEDDTVCMWNLLPFAKE